MDAGEAEAGRLLQRGGEGAVEVGIRRLRDAPSNEIHRLVHEHTRRHALRVAFLPPAVGVGHAGEAVEAPGGAQRGGVGPRGVAVDAGEVDGAIRECGVEVGAGRKRVRAVGGGGPVVLIPPAPDDPRPNRTSGGERLETSDNVGLRGRPDEVGGERRHRKAHQVAVRVDQAGHNGCATQVVDGQIRMGAPHGVGCPDGSEMAVHDGKRLRLRTGIVYGVDAGVGHDKRLRRRGRGGKHGEDDKTAHRWRGDEADDTTPCCDGSNDVTDRG